MAERYDIVIIGGGNAGFGVSSIAAAAGKRIAFVEDRDFGGTCPNRGCTPKKVLVAAAHAMHEIDLASAHGIEVGPPRLDWPRLIAREKALIADIPERMEGLARTRGDVFCGRARFVGPNAVAIGDTVVKADSIVIATGSKPRALPFPGAEHMITSDEVLDETELPREVVFVGGGVIAMEFSHVYARAGARVTILETLPGVLPALDLDAVSVLVAESERLAITIRTGVEVRGITRADGRLSVRYRHDGQEAEVSADRVVNGAGRVANVDGLDLDAGGVRHDGIRIEVEPSLRSISNPAVWVAGDALVGPAQLSPLATHEGQVVGRNIVNGTAEVPDYSAVPSCVYTVPALANVGMTERAAQDAGLAFDAKTSDMAGWFATKTYAETTAWSKVLVERGTARILGAHIIGHSGEELIHFFALAMKHGITTEQIRDMVFGFPTFSADIKSML